MRGECARTPTLPQPAGSHGPAAGVVLAAGRVAASLGAAVGSRGSGSSASEVGDLGGVVGVVAGSGLGFNVGPAAGACEAPGSRGRRFGEPLGCRFQGRQGVRGAQVGFRRS